MHRTGTGAWFSRRARDSETLLGLAQRALARQNVVAALPFPDGMANTCVRVEVAGSKTSRVLRFFEADPTACARERDLLTALAGEVPVPGVIEAQPESRGDVPPFLLLEYIEGITFRDLKNRGDRTAIAEAAASVGTALAGVARLRFPRAGRLAPALSVGEPFLRASNPLATAVEVALDKPAAIRRVRAEVREKIVARVREWSPRLLALQEDTRLVHGDFGAANVLVDDKSGRWKVAAVIDWEFAFSGTPLTDVAHFLRYERTQRPLREPAFSRAYREAGGELPDDWRELSRVVDLAELCGVIAREDADEAAALEVVGMVEATLAHADPP